MKRNLFLMLTLLPALSMQALWAVEEDQEPASGDRRADAVLGMYEEFGRWNTPLQIVYDPDDAPDQFADTTRFLEILQQTFHEWEVVSGIRIHVLDPDSDIADDVSLAPQFHDGLVRVFWGPGENFAGRAGPQSGNYDYDLGYRPYHDGDIELNNTPGTFMDEGSLKKVLLHESGHLIGLGHSDDPDSVMYANPYNRLPHPRADDIRAVQVLYGPPDNPVNVSEAVPAWTFIAPPEAPATRTQRLFRPGEGLPAGPAFSLQSGGGANAAVGELITTITRNSPPVARISTEPGANADTVVVRVRAEDFDSPGIQVKWQVPGRYDLDRDGINDTFIMENMVSGEELARTFTLGGTGLHTLFVGLSDLEARYADDQDRLNYDVAGRGYQTLIRIDVTVPYLPGDEARIGSTQSANVPDAAAMLAWMAADKPLGGVIAWGGDISRARLFASASRNGGASSDTMFLAGDNVAVAGRIEPQDTDIGKAAGIYIVLYDAARRFYYRDLEGIFRPWNARMTDLEPAYEIAALSESEAFRIYEGILAAGKNRVFIGYRIATGGPMHLNSTALRVDVE